MHRLQQGAVRGHEDEADDEEEGDDDPRRPGEGEERGEDAALLVLPAEGEVAPAAGGAAVFGDLGRGVRSSRVRLVGEGDDGATRWSRLDRAGGRESDKRGEERDEGGGIG